MEAPMELYELNVELAPCRSNGMFPEWTDDHIRALAINTQAEIDLLDGEVSKARILLANLQDQHDQKTERLLWFRRAISPLNQIPAEILGEIFVLCCEGKPTALPPNPSSQPRYPWTLGQVSSHWREVLQSTPEVWRNLEVGNVSSKNDTTIKVALEIFSRVKGGLSLSTREMINLENPMGIFILKSVGRFRHLIITPSYLLQSAFLKLPSGSLDTLESIEIKLRSAGSIISPHQATALQTARKLTKATFELRGAPAPCPTEILLLPWGQLTEVSLIKLMLSSTAAHSILNQCHRLISCTFAIDTTRSSLSYPSCKETIIPTLRSLTLVAESTRLNWAELLRPLELSSLKNLDLQFADTLEDETLASFLVRPRCALETLRWRTHRISETEPDKFHLVLGQLASLRTLTIPYHYLPPAVFEAISRNQWLPEIQHLVCRVEPSGLQAFTDLVEHCIQESSGRIKSATLTCNLRQHIGIILLCTSPILTPSHRPIHLAAPRGYEESHV